MSADCKIWEDFKNGNEYALSQIYYNNVQFLYQYGKRFSDDENLLKDTIQELFLDLIRKRTNLGETDNIKFYLMVSFRRRLFNSFKKHNNNEALQEDYNKYSKITYSIEHELIEKEKLEQRDGIIYTGLNELSSKQKEALYYRFICGLEYGQICEIMSLKYDSARKLVSRALQSLKKQLVNTNISVFL